MKPWRIIAFFTCLLMAGKTYAQVQDSVPLIMADSLKAVYIYADTGTAINHTDAKGRKQGLWEKKYPDGKLRYRGHFYNNNPVGVFKYWYDNDSVESITAYSEKGKVARATIFYENGGIFSMGKFVNHEKDSIWVYYDETLKLYKKEQYILGKKEGKSVTFYGNGNVEETKNWHNGLENGPWQQFYEDGQLKLESGYVDGKRTGPIKVYKAGNADTPVVTGNYENDLRNGPWLYLNSATGAMDTIVYKNDRPSNHKYQMTEHKLDSMRIKNQGVQQKLDNPGSLQNEYNMGRGGDNEGGQ